MSRPRLINNTERFCEFPECSNIRRTEGLCLSHLHQRLSGKPLTPLRPKKTLYEGCKMEGCLKAHYARGYCRNDYEYVRRNRLIPTRVSHAYLELPDETIRAIRDAYASGGVTYKELALAYGISRTTINRIVLRQAWSHVA